MKEHRYETTVKWMGDQGPGTSHYAAYSRDHQISGAGKSATIPGSSDPGFLGDPARYNPEELLLASLSACHMLWYLHFCAVNNVVVTAYEDHAEGTMTGTADGSGRFTSVVLKPCVAIAPASNPEKAAQLHEEAHKMCFIAHSVNFPVQHKPTISHPAN